MSPKLKVLTIVSLIAALSWSAPVVAQGTEQPPIPTPFPTPDFHFADPARDAQYWRLKRDEVEKLALFREASDAAQRALMPPLPAPGSPRWMRARDLLEQAIRARVPARDALNALIDFVTRERPRLSPAEAEAAFDIRRVHEETLTATSDFLVLQLAYLAGLKIDRWPP
jgi:hypothetical protein